MIYFYIQKSFTFIYMNRQTRRNSFYEGFRKNECQVTPDRGNSLPVHLVIHIFLEKAIFPGPRLKKKFFQVFKMSIQQAWLLMQDAAYVRLCICSNCPAILGHYIEFHSARPELEGQFCIKFVNLNTIIQLNYRFFFFPPKQYKRFPKCSTRELKFSQSQLLNLF